MANFLSKLFDPNERTLKKYKTIVTKINILEERMEALTDEQLKEKTEEFKKRYAKGETLDELQVEAFAVVREASKRVLQMRPYDVQLMGAMALHEGSIAEMKTGEGKTLASTLGVYLNAIEGKGVHVITANEYLASRDCEEMGKLYTFLGLTVGLNVSNLTSEEKKEAYNCDITYGTASEFGFDYLRDNMVVYQEEKVQRKLNFVIVDEVDSILIDEARTPLIISGQDNESTSMYTSANRFVQTLNKENDYKYDLESKSVTMTESGVEKAEKYFGIENLYDYQQVNLNHHINMALRANIVMQKDIDYMVRDGEVLIIDQFTGRVMDGRRYSDGLHQAIEAKESVQIERESKTLATVTIQNYFRMYNKIAGMTGTAKTEEEEFLKIYNMPVIVIPTNVPIERIDHPDVIYMTLKAKFDAVIKEIEELHRKGQPILVGTISVETSELISAMLKKKGIKHNVLNAKNHGRESEIIAQAGIKGAVTIATNMAGRGTDIKLGEGVKELGGLAVIGTEKHESRRIDNQLRGRSGRQGDPGMSRFYLSAEDELLQRFGGENLKKTMQTFKLDETDPLESKMITRTIESSQKRVEGNNFDIRKRLLEYDDVVREQREIIYKQRDEVLETENTKEMSLNMIQAYTQDVVERFTQGDIPENWQLEGLYEYLSTELIGANDFDTVDFKGKEREELVEYVWEKVKDFYETKEKEFTSETMRELEKILMLRAVDDNWIDHIDALSRLRDGIHLRSYAQTNPLYEYQFEGFGMFEEMVKRIQENYSKMILLIEKEQEVRREQTIEGNAVKPSTEENVKKKPIVKSVHVGRNDPCPCGSGKKYKKCHGKN